MRPPSLREPGRHPLTRVVARVLIAALVVTSFPQLASASFATNPPGGHIHADGIGSIRRLTNEAGTVTDTYSYTAFGERLGQTGTDPQPYSFAGEPLDVNSGFQYHRARWMDPKVGRFAGHDPWDGDPLIPPSLHRYLYGDSSPSWKVDPTGRSPLIGVLAVAAVIVIVAAIAIPLLQRQIRTRSVAVKWSTDFVFGRARLSTVERDAVKTRAHSVARTAFTGLPLTLVEGGSGRHRLEVVNVPTRFTHWGGITNNDSESQVFYSPHEIGARGYGASLGYDRAFQLSGLGQSLGATIAHETAHQILWGKPGQRNMDHRGDPATYDYWRDSSATFFGSLKWSDPTLTALQAELAAR